VPLYALIAVAAARAAQPPISPIAPTAAPTAAPAAAAPPIATEPVADAPASASDDEPESVEGQRHAERHARHRRHDHGAQGNDVFNIGRDSTVAQGEKANSVVSIFGSAISDGEAGDIVSILGDTRVTGEVKDSAVAVLGNMYIDGKVEGDAVTVMGNVELGPHADIEGDVVAVGGSLQRDPAAIVRGDVQNVFGGNFAGVGWLRAWVQHCLFYARPLAFAHGLNWAWELAFAFLALYMVLALLFREGLSRCVQTFESRPGETVLAALITALLTPVVVVLLCVTVIGVAAVPFVVIGLFCAGLFGKAVILAWIGWRITGRQRVGPKSHPAVAVLIGGALVLVLYVIPVVGFLAYKVLGYLGLGAVVYTMILASRARQAAKDGPGGAAAAPQAMSPPNAASAPEAAASPPEPAGSAAGPAPAAEHAAAPQAAPQAPRTPAPPPITAALPRAGFCIRMVALLLDFVLVGFLMSVLHHEYNLEFVVLAAYGAVMWKTRGSTIGGSVFDLRVVRLDGRPIDWETAIVRALSCFLSMVVVGLGFIWIAFDSNKQAWHDKIAGTVVVRVAKGVPLV
jgi:uncharacterized RDD family membrane protein YckC/cytoskeletal protein CcmA (bactofilin family)